MNILITGGASGLGKSITETMALSFPEAKIFFTYFSSAEVAVAIETNLKNTTALKLNFKEKQSVDGFSEKIASLDIDILIHNALTGLHRNHFHKVDTDMYMEGFKENIYPVLKLTRAFIKTARVKKSGRLITILSSAVQGMPPTGMAGYIAEKNYLLAMSKSWASENVQFNIQSNCISPDFMDTPLNKGTDSRIKEEIIKSQPLKKLLTTEETAEIVRFLATAPPHLTGQNILLNNGKN